MEKDLLFRSKSARRKEDIINNQDALDAADTLSYTHTLMYGRYATDLSDYARNEARKLKILEKHRKGEDRRRHRDRNGILRKLGYWLWHNTLAQFGGEWILLVLLGVIMALLSFLMDWGVQILMTVRYWLYHDLFNSSLLVQYLAWTFPILCLVLFSVGFVYVTAPHAAGSGIPEMKTILRGVVLKEYLTFKTLLAKVIGLTAALGSGIPIGKEGPFVHIASIVASLLSKLRFRGINENKSHYNDMLATGCAVGIGACFAAPIGGVLFSIEATTTYFAVRNCWRGFFSAVIGSSVFLLMAVWFRDQSTVKALFLTNFTSEFPYASQELFVFALVGVVCGFLGAGYVWLHRRYVMLIRSSKSINGFLQKNRFIYPTIITLIVASVSFPYGSGKYVAAELSTHEQLTELFSNFTWSRDDLTVEQAHIVSHWKTPNTSIFVSLAGYVLFTYIFSCVCYTLPVPSGAFIPVFKIGSGLGRIFGELMHLLLPQGVWYGEILSSIIPGGYAVVAAAAFASAVTHTCSEAVIIFEITGQVTHVVPVMIASLIANAVAELLQPSMYDSMILIKKLPYLPDLLPTSSRMYTTYVNDFMVRDIKCIWFGMTYEELKIMLLKTRNIRSLPLVDSRENMILLGCVQRQELMRMLDRQIGRERRMEVAREWQTMAEQRAQEELQHELEEEQRQFERRRSSRFEVTPAPDILSLEQKSTNLNDAERGQMPNGCGSSKKVHLSKDCLIDMTPEEKKHWEYAEVMKPIDLEEHEVFVDPSPFQMVERTSIIKVHTLFNMVGVNHAYVTKVGRLVGIVGLTELRKAIEDINNNTFEVPVVLRDDEVKPLIDSERSDKHVNMTITSLDSAISTGSSMESDGVAKKNP